jgi:hypothetical protein
MDKRDLRPAIPSMTCSVFSPVDVPGSARSTPLVECAPDGCDPREGLRGGMGGTDDDRRGSLQGVVELPRSDLPSAQGAASGKGGTGLKSKRGRQPGVRFFPRLGSVMNSNGLATAIPRYSFLCTHLPRAGRDRSSGFFVPPFTTFSPAHENTLRPDQTLRTPISNRRSGSWSMF